MARKRSWVAALALSLPSVSINSLGPCSDGHLDAHSILRSFPSDHQGFEYSDLVSSIQQFNGGAKPRQTSTDHYDLGLVDST